MITAALLWACANSVPFDGDTYLITRQTHQLSVGQPALDFQAEPSGSESISVSAGQTSWQITAVPDWLTVSPTKGTGSSSVKISCAVNYAESPREGVLAISSTDDEWPYTLSVHVTQQAHLYETVTYKVGDYELVVVPIAGDSKLSSFSLMQTEVTQGFWEAVTGSRHDTGASPSMPVCGVSWDDCQTFITRLRELTGFSLRLPTEAEWEFAARGGTKSAGFTYSGSNVAADVAVTRNVSSVLKEAKTLLPNELGLYDMSGNAYEWCSDYFDGGTQRVIRGGSYAHDDDCARTAHRAGRLPETRSESIGFRLAIGR